MQENKSQVLQLLQKIRKEQEEIYVSQIKERETGTLNPQKLINAALKADFSGIEETSPEFVEYYREVSIFHKHIRTKIAEAIAANQFELTEFHKALVVFSINISNAYTDYYESWMTAMIKSPAALFIKSELESNPEQLNDFIIKNKMNNGYTVITVENTIQQASYDNLIQVPYAVAFEKELPSIIKAFDIFEESIAQLSLTEQDRAMVTYLAQYKTALQCTDIEVLDKTWEEVDRLWMDTTSWIEIVHDIEDHYGDPLGVKIIPEVSIRFLDESVVGAQEQFAAAKQVLKEYYTNRKSAFADKGMSPLENSKAGIYYIPFSTAMSVHFKFAGQSIPNRTNVKLEKGVKIYLDYQSNLARTERAKELFVQVFGEKYKNYVGQIKTDDQMIHHVVPHEYGHTICNFGDYAPQVPNSFSQNLEELRADLNALASLHILRTTGKFTDDQLLETVVGYIAHELRRFAMWTSNSVQPYKYSMLHIFDLLKQTEIIRATPTLELSISVDLAEKFLQTCYNDLEKLHNALDTANISYLQELFDSILRFSTDELCAKILDKLK